MNSLFEDALDIPAWLEGDRALAFRERAHRDRKLGLAIRGSRPLVRVRAWWRQVDADARPELGAKLKRTRAWVSLVLCAAGALLGSGLALAVLRYDGHYPVNVVAALALLVIAPLLLMIASLLLMPGRVPGLRMLQDAVATVNVGNLAASVFNRFATRPVGELNFDWGGSRGGPLARLAKWQVMFFSQLAGLSFSLAATLTAFALVVFTDLAFGWSTTLDVAALQAHRVVELVSWPWGQWVGDAVPGVALVEESRFFRLDSGDPLDVAAGRLTGWWPFLLMSLLTYGVLPRCVLLVVARARLSAATRDVLLEDVGVRALLDRMDSAVLDSEGEGEEPPVESSSHATRASVRFADTVRVVAWDLAGEEELVDEWLTTHVEKRHGSPVFLGGDNELAADELALTAFSTDDSTMVLVLVKGWEPPLLDCMDVLRSLRTRVGSQASLLVVPLGLDVGAPRADELDAWRHAIARLADPGVYVEALTEAAGKHDG